MAKLDEDETEAMHKLSADLRSGPVGTPRG